MKSPFPGMDPYLEAHWGAVHQRLCTYAGDALAGELPSDLSATLEERLVVEIENELRNIYPDLHIIRHPPPTATGDIEDAGGTLVATQPIRVTRQSEARREPFIEIRTSHGKVITIIEFLSPGNKLSGEAGKKYRSKQQSVQQSDVNFVEIDLTRSGKRELLCHAADIAEVPNAPYLISVWRAAKADCYELYPAYYDRRLPNISIPLRPTDKDVVLALQPLVDTTYANGRYYRTIDYSKPAIPPLPASMPGESTAASQAV